MTPDNPPNKVLALAPGALVTGFALALAVGNAASATVWLPLAAVGLGTLALAWRAEANTAARIAAARSVAGRAEAFARGILDGAAEASLLLGHDGKVRRANPSAALLFGVPLDQLTGAAFASPFADPELVMTALDKARTRGTLREVALVLRRGEATRDILLGATLLEQEGDAPRELLATLRDVSEARREVRDAHRRADETRALVDASPEPLFAVAPDGTVLDANAAARERAGRSQTQLIGHPFAALFADADLARRALEHGLRDGSVRETPLVLRDREGAGSHVLFSGTVYRDAQGTTVGVLCTARDVTAVRKAEQERDAKDWLVAGIARLNTVVQGEGATVDLARRIVSEITEHAGAQVGALYAQELDGDGQALSLRASHAYTRRKGVATRYLPGEGVVGQAALERRQILVVDLPDDYIVIASGTGEARPRSVSVTPLLFEGGVKGVIELASFATPSDMVLEYIRQAALIVAVALEASLARERVGKALARSQELAAELEVQQDTLRNTNAELEEQASALKTSERKLMAQQAEIELANAELEQKNELLERQRNETEEARRTVAAHAEEVALSSKYKSEFLANMSHELRTPLNSLLLLARALRDNASGNLDAEQVESARIIFESGSDLLNLINEILDLSKIEAGKMELRIDEVEVGDVSRSLLAQFGHMARAQGLTLAVDVDAAAPASIVSDAQRVGQILKNLIGNAIKFTERGRVSVTFARPSPGVVLSRSGLDPARAIAVHVTDTGIGIPVDKQKLIFEAFQQADSGDRRRFGGTGLGLSISRELANLLGGEIQVVSTPGHGSTFSVYLPESLAPGHGRARINEGDRSRAASTTAPASLRAGGSPPRAGTAAAPAAERPRSPIADDRGAIQEHDRVVLVIEDDLRFAGVLVAHVRQRGLKCLHAASGEEGLELAREHRPHGVVLDIELPGMDGWAVLTALKQDVSLRHIPVHIVSVDEASTVNLGIGAIGHAAKPITWEQIDEVLRRLESASAHAVKHVLVVEDDPLMRQETARVIGNGNVKVHAVGTAREALEALDALGSGTYALVVMDLGLPDMQGVDMLKTLAEQQRPMPPVIIHTVRELTMEEELFLRNYSDSIIIKDVRSQERLIDEVALFLHRVVRELPEDKRRAILHVRESNEPLRGKKVLIVEDDMRTMFAMARMLAAHGVHPVKAENGERALAVLEEHPDTDLVLLDMMMPILDGYETARRLRADPRFARVPVIALTAKAMREDRQKCIDAGCTDYISKPVDPERLASLMRVLLFR